MQSKNVRKFISWFVSIGIVASVGVFTAVPSTAIENCWISAAPRYVTSNTSGTFAGATATVTVFWEQNPAQDCIVGTRFSFIGGGGQDFQQVTPGFTRNGTRVQASASFTPKSGLSYVVEVFITWQMMGSPYEAYPNTLNINSGRPFPEAPVPTGLAAPAITAEDRNLIVRWSPPTTNASSVFRYRVVNVANAQQVCETAAGNLGCNFEGLADGSYSYQVVAVNSLGKGSTSPASSAVRIGMPPAPTITRVESKGTDVTLTWGVVSDTSTIPRIYRVHDSQGKEVCGVAVTAADISAGNMSCKPLILDGSSTQFIVTMETALGNIASAPTPVVTGVDVTKSSQCLQAKSRLKKISKTGNKKTIAVAKKRAAGACTARVVVY